MVAHVYLSKILPALLGSVFFFFGGGFKSTPQASGTQTHEKTKEAFSLAIPNQVLEGKTEAPGSQLRYFPPRICC